MTLSSSKRTDYPTFFTETYLGVILLGWSMWIVLGLFIAACAWVGTVWK